MMHLIKIIGIIGSLWFAVAITAATICMFIFWKDNSDDES